MSTQLSGSMDIIIYPLPHPMYKASTYIIFQDGLVVEHRFHIGPDKVTMVVGATVDVTDCPLLPNLFFLFCT